MPITYLVTVQALDGTVTHSKVDAFNCHWAMRVRARTLAAGECVVTAVPFMGRMP